MPVFRGLVAAIGGAQFWVLVAELSIRQLESLQNILACGVKILPGFRRPCLSENYGPGQNYL